jgi:RNA-directed DNA polymerase
MSTERPQIAERAKKFKGEPLTNLHQFIDEDLLGKSYRKLNKNSSPGVDKKYWHNYSAECLWRLPELLAEFKSGSYKAPPIRRVYIPKGKTGKRPLGIPTIEDKILQESVRNVLNPIYEEDFKSFSYGFRNDRSAHQALDYMFKKVSFGGMRYIIDADIKDYFGSIDHGILREFLDRRVKDGVIRKMIDKWLKAGILEKGQLSYPTEGTPQGGIISPLLSNIYLHYVLDEWYSEQIQPLLAGKSFLVRYADDFVMGFENLADAERVMKVLPLRFGKYNLELHPEKTQLISLEKQGEKGNRSFDFLGFTHYLAKSRKGKQILKRNTSKKKLTAALERTHDWIKQNRHMKLRELIKELNMKLRGHYNYYGITLNSRGINGYYLAVMKMLHKWLNRRGGKQVWNKERYEQLINKGIPLLKPKIYHSQLSTKPI